MSFESTLLALGSSGVTGSLIGFALKGTLKMLAIIIGLFLSVLIYLQSQSILSINWDKQSISQSLLFLIGNFMNSTGVVTNVTDNTGLHLTGSSSGIVLGFTKDKRR